MTYDTIAPVIAAHGDETAQATSGIYENVNVNKQLTLRGIGMPVVNAMGSGSSHTMLDGQMSR